MDRTRMLTSKVSPELRQGLSQISMAAYMEVTKQTGSDVAARVRVVSMLAEEAANFTHDSSANDPEVLREYLAVVGAQFLVHLISGRATDVRSKAEQGDPKAMEELDLLLKMISYFKRL